MKIRKTLGIDLGTTNSVIALLDATGGGILTGRDEQGHATFPSVVGYHPEQGRIVAGRPAARLRADGGGGQDGGPVWLSSVKRFMGLEHRFRLGPELLSPPQVSAHVLRLLRDVLAGTLNDPRYLLDSAVITMPAYFSHNQIEATRQAGELAGLEVVELLHEPTAAAIYYSWVERHRDALYLVYDLGGGTFDVSVIRRRLDDYEVLGVSGDPFLGGDDFDRLLATHLLHRGRWTRADRGGAAADAAELASHFDAHTPAGAAAFSRLMAVAEGMKIELASRERAERSLPAFQADPAGATYSLEAELDRATFERLIEDKVRRTIDCCQEALARARERAGVRLGDIDHILLVGGSSRVPLVERVVRSAFCSPDLPERARCAAPLLHEPDLCVAYGAALRAASHGTRFLIDGLRGAGEAGGLLQLHWTSPLGARTDSYLATGSVRRVGAGTTDGLLAGGSVRIRSLATGLVEEAYLDERGTFAQEVALERETDNPLEVSVCDEHGRPLAAVSTCVRHREQVPALGQGILPTQLITRPLQIEVLNRARQRVKQVVAPVGAPLPGVFQCTCRTHDQAGHIVVPIFEENRVIKHMVVADLDPGLPVGSPVDVELSIDVKHTIEVRVRVRRQDGGLARQEHARIEPAPAPGRPTPAEADAVWREVEQRLGQLHGSQRTRLRGKAEQLRADLLEALHYADEPRAIQRLAELRDLSGQLELARSQQLDPPWPRFTQLVRHCLDLAAEVADRTGRSRDELFAYVQAQERYAEKAYEEHSPALYRECLDNLRRHAGYLESLLHDRLHRPAPRPSLPPEEEARLELERFRGRLTSLWKEVRERGRGDLDRRLGELARNAQEARLQQRGRTEPEAVLRELRRLGTELYKMEELLRGPQGQFPEDSTGLLEGTS